MKDRELYTPQHQDVYGYNVRFGTIGLINLCRVATIARYIRQVQGNVKCRDASINNWLSPNIVYCLGQYISLHSLSSQSQDFQLLRNWDF